MKTINFLRLSLAISLLSPSFPAISMDSEESSEEYGDSKAAIKNNRLEEKKKAREEALERARDERARDEKYRKARRQYAIAQAKTLIEEERRKENDEYSAMMSRRNEEIERQQKAEIQREVDEINAATSELVRYRVAHPELWSVLRIPSWQYNKK